MTRFALKALAVLVMATTLAVVPTHAQQHNQMTLNIPFAFTVGDTTLPAGTYLVLRPLTTSGAYMIRSVDGKGNALVLSPSSQQARKEEPAKLVFNAYDGEYFLAQIWMPWSTSGADLAASRHEKRLARAGDRSHVVALVVGKP